MKLRKLGGIGALSVKVRSVCYMNNLSFLIQARHKTFILFKINNFMFLFIQLLRYTSPEINIALVSILTMFKKTNTKCARTVI
jgi:hypothetical protein